MFELNFTPGVQGGIAQQHVAELRATRITLKTGADIYREVFYGGLFPGRTRHPDTIRKEKFLIEEGRAIWPVFEADVSQGLDILKDTSSFTAEQKALIDLALTGIIDCKVNCSDFRKSTFADFKLLAEKLTSEGPAYTPWVHFFTYCIKMAPLYCYACTNTIDQSENWLVENRFLFPKDGILYSYCIALLPETERAFAIYTWLEAARRGNEFMTLMKIKSFLDDSEGRPLNIQPTNKKTN